jgi:site-specific DNA-methyltransferase (adenine-specific)
MTGELFDLPERKKQTGDSKLDQYFTPKWAAEELVARFFPNLGKADLVIEPACGRAPFLSAVPVEAEAIGVDIDPQLCEEARANTGRQIICGDFAKVPLPTASAIVGNPPFRADIIDAFLRRSYGLLPNEGRCAFLLPAYMLQTPSRILKWNRHWSLSQTLLPRTLFQRARLPLLFVLFEKGCGPRRLVGFTLYHEAHDINGMPNWAKLLLMHGEPRKQTWRSVVDVAMRKIGGRGTLTEIYNALKDNRPSENKWWKDKVRQVLQLYCVRVGPGEWALP